MEKKKNSFLLLFLLLLLGWWWENLTASDSDEVFCMPLTWCSSTCIVPFVEEVIKSAEALFFEYRWPRIKVRIPVNVALGMEGSWPPSNSGSERLAPFLSKAIRRTEYQACAFFSREWRAFMPSSARKAVKDTVMTEIDASTCWKNTCHSTSILFLPARSSPTMRKIATMIMQMLRQRNRPRTNLWLRLILTFQSMTTGIMMTAISN